MAKKISGIQATKSSLKNTKKMNALDTAISKGKSLPSKNKKGSVPPDYDVIMPGMGYTKPTKKNPPKKIKKK